MSQRQFVMRKRKAAHKPSQRPPVIIKKGEVGDKRPFTPLPALIQRATQSPDSITPAETAYLQRSMGNQALGRLTRIQAKLTLGPIGDKYEQEADAVAKQVVGRLSDGEQTEVQRQEDEEEVQMQSVSGLQRQEDEEDLQMKPIAHLQRLEEEEEVQMKSSSSTMEGGDLSDGIEDQIKSAKGGGRPLSPNIQSSMSQAFNTDFSGVKVHTDGQSDRLNQSIQARAFTTGQDIFFRQGEYNPDSSGGQELLAHELTHTIQQTGGQAQRQSVVQRLIQSHDFERDAGITAVKSSGGMNALLETLIRYNAQKSALIGQHGSFTDDPTISDYAKLLDLLTLVENKATTWKNTTGKSWGLGRLFRKGANARHDSKKTAVNALLTQIPIERTDLTQRRTILATQLERAESNRQAEIVSSNVKKLHGDPEYKMEKADPEHREPNLLYYCLNRWKEETKTTVEPEESPPIEFYSYVTDLEKKGDAALEKKVIEYISKKINEDAGSNYINDWITKRKKVGQLVPRITYLETDDAREKFHLEFEGNNILYAASKRKLGNSRNIYVMTPDMEFYAARESMKIALTRHHSSFLGGGDVGAAGTLGKSGLWEISLDSGHYRPEQQHMVNALYGLQKQGVQMDKIRSMPLIGKKNAKTKGDHFLQLVKVLQKMKESAFSELKKKTDKTSIKNQLESFSNDEDFIDNSARVLEEADQKQKDDLRQVKS